jgi:HEPN domain-containing protein
LDGACKSHYRANSTPQLKGAGDFDMNNLNVVFQAKAFYNAYINLERINRESGGVYFLSPMIVNGAFSIELSIKAILINQGISYNRDHNLVVLFRLLPEYIQKMIWEWVISKTPEYADEGKRNTEFVLVSEAFKQWRYVFEEAVPAFDTRFLSSFANASIGVMYKLGYNVDVVQVNKDETDEEINQYFENNRQEMFEKNTEHILHIENRQNARRQQLL